MRNRKKKEKVRVCINLDKEIVDRIDEYIDNLSGFINKTLKNYIEFKDKEQNIVVPDNNIGYVQNYDHKKRTPVDNEVLNTENKWWDS